METPTRYVRVKYDFPRPFFTVHWYVGFILLLIAFLVLVLALYIAICCHFKEREQNKRRKEIEKQGGMQGVANGAGSRSVNNEEEGSNFEDGASHSPGSRRRNPLL